MLKGSTTSRRCMPAGNSIRKKKMTNENLVNERDNHWKGKIRKPYSSLFAYLRVVLRRQKPPFVFQNLLRNGDLLIFRCMYEPAFSRKAFLRRGRFRGILRFNRKPMIEPVRLIGGGEEWVGRGKGMIRSVGNGCNRSHIISHEIWTGPMNRIESGVVGYNSIDKT